MENRVPVTMITPSNGNTLNHSYI